MRGKALIAASLVAAAISCCGCTTTQSNKGFQTNAPTNNGIGVAQDFQNQNDPQGIRKFFAGFNNGNKNQPPKIESSVAGRKDATSLQTPGTVSAELLIVAGEMGLQQSRFDLAKSYFERALKIDPENARAKIGLSNAMNRVQVRSPSNNQRNARNPGMINSFGQNSMGKGAINRHMSDQPMTVQALAPSNRPSEGIRLVSFDEEVVDSVEEDFAQEEGPDTISVANLEKKRKAHMTMSPAISALRSPSKQRVANPYFTHYRSPSESTNSRPTSSRAKTSWANSAQAKSKKKNIFKIRPVKVKFDRSARSITDESM